jgi:hypothetical protein
VPYTEPPRPPNYPAARRRRARPLHGLWWALVGTATTVSILRFVFDIDGPIPAAVGVAAFVLTFLLYLYDDDAGWL